MEKKVSINLTTTSNRLDLCAVTVWSLMNQTVIPNEINIWISKESYLADNGIDTIPDWVAFFNKNKNIIRVNYTKNTGPYRKIIPALRAAQFDDVLVYADDDVIYGASWLELLLKKFFETEGEMAVCARARLKKKNLIGNVKNYKKMKLCKKESVLDKDFIITGVGGCVLTKKFISDKYLFNDDYITVAPKTDDIWISKILELSGTKVICIPHVLNQISEIYHTVNPLNYENSAFIFGVGYFKKGLSAFTYVFRRLMDLPVSNNDFAIKQVDDYFYRVFK